ncbi:MAG: FAD-dependent oxidoreductase [Coriobacteriales bacterium]|jgi:glycerol-3-phosphate dehydrogenase
MSEALFCQVAVIGGGIVGCMAARELSRYKLDVIVLERNNDVGKGSSKANSGIIHTGFQPREGTLKGLSCVRGNALYTQICSELEVPFERIGALYCAFGPNGLEKMHEKHDRALANGAGDLPILSGDEARELEPRLSDKVIAAMRADSTGIISPFALVIACAENAAQNGVRFRFEAQVETVERVKGRWAIHLADGTRVDADYVINTAGDQAAIIDCQVHDADLIVRPRRGQFYVFDKQGTLGGPPAIRHALFQAQENDEGGTLLTPTIDGNILAGPTSENVRYFHQNATSQAGLDHVRDVARKLVPDLQLGRVITAFAGVRANITNVVKEKKDFVVRESAPGFVSALGIKNPGMTSAPVLAQRAVRILGEAGLPLEPDPAFDPHRKRRVPFLQCDHATQERLLKEDASFGHVLCRCEKITEGDVRRELAGILPPHDFEGLKHRLRVSMGRCQGGFCKPRVTEILEGAPPLDVRDIPAEVHAVASDDEIAVDVLVVGAGAAGIAAAAAAGHAGASVLLVEREAYLGGVLPQCIHDGFGLYVFGENLTGPQYLERWQGELDAAGVKWACATSVTELSHTGDVFRARVVGMPLGGARAVTARSVVIASGCREVTRGQLRIPGTRPEGIYTAGTAQYMVNIEHKLPGDKVVILGGGDIGLIMARRMTLSGAEVRLLVAKEATGLVRNHRRCIDPYHIQTRYGWGVASIHGYGRLKGVMVAPFNKDGSYDMERREYVRCNTLLISCGLVPERELYESVEGAPGLFICGNAESVHDLVDRVSVEALRTGLDAARVSGHEGSLPDWLEEVSRLRIGALPVGEHVKWLK